METVKNIPYFEIPVLGAILKALQSRTVVSGVATVIFSYLIMQDPTLGEYFTADEFVVLTFAIFAGLGIKFHQDDERAARTGQG